MAHLPPTTCNWGSVLSYFSAEALQRVDTAAQARRQTVSEWMCAAIDTAMGTGGGTAMAAMLGGSALVLIGLALILLVLSWLDERNAKRFKAIEERLDRLEGKR